MTDPVIRFSVQRVPNCPPDIGLWLAILKDARERLNETFDYLAPSDLDAPPPIGQNTIGTLYYHVALADLNWVYDNMLMQPYPEDIAALFPYPLTDEHGRLSVVSGWDIDAYRLRLNAARAKVFEVFQAMSDADFRAILQRTESFGDYEMTPESVLRHLTQHEAEHRGEIQLFIGARRRGRASER
jgi:uncharacterized damage-inducible protein DinB